jgi:dihydroorotase
VTTNSSAGVTDCTNFFPVFAAMEKHDLVLNLHGEVILRISMLKSCFCQL